MFIATNDGFYFDDVKTICENEGNISPLEYLHIPKDFRNNIFKFCVILRKEIKWTPLIHE